MARIALGLVIVSAMVSAGCGGSAPAPVTFNKDVAPVVFQNCVTCHRPGGDAPFSLLTYAEAAARADDIADATRGRHMPPWLPEPGDVPLVGVRRLSQTQIDTIQRWVSGGVLEGAAADLPPAPAVPAGWQLGTPDVVLTVPRPYVLNPGGEDVYRNLLLQGGVPADTYIRAVELRTNGSPIHHALIRIARGGAARDRDGEGGQPGFSGMSSEILEDPEGQFLGWAPGRGPMVSPEGMPWLLERGTSLALELHMIPPAEPRPVQPSVALYFAKAPPERRPVMTVLASKLIDIPPGDANYVVADRHQLPVAADLIGLFPHAHYLGREMVVTATPPGERPRTLLHIPRWSFHWQQDYRFVTPVPLPRGTVIEMRYTYDNSAANPANPAKPPVRVRLGSRSTDEMANLSLQWLTSSPADAAALQLSFLEKHVLGNIAYAEARLRDRPDSFEDRLLLGGSYVKLGRYAEALPHLEAALALDPRSPAAHSQLGGAYLGLGRLPLAVQHFDRAARLSPRDDRARVNLADALLKAGRVAAAEAAYRQALALNNDAFIAHVKLADLLVTAGRLADALPHFRRLVELRPNSPDTHSDLGGALVSLGQPAEAADHLRRALELDPNHAGARQNLAVLQRGGR